MRLLAGHSTVYLPVMGGWEGSSPLAPSGVELLILACVLLPIVLGIWAIFRGRLVRLNEEHRTALTPGELEVPLATSLTSLSWVEVNSAAPDTWVLRVTQGAAWTVVLAVALFPIGLAFLLLRDRADLVVMVRPSDGGSTIHLMGRTSVGARDALQRLLTELPTRQVNQV